MEKKFDKVLKINLQNEAETDLVIKALNCKTRRDILRLLGNEPLGIWEIAMALNVPLSSISEHVSVLIKAGIVSVIRKSASRGNSKIISRQYEKIELAIVPTTATSVGVREIHTVQIPIGSYTDFHIRKYCGMIGENGYIGGRDDPNIFYHPMRSSAGLIWFDCGYMEYKIPLPSIQGKTVQAIAFSLELCSEAPGYNENWQSDIYFEINGKRIGTYTSPGDFGARRGRHTPSWWKNGTQYGLLKKIEVNTEGSFLDGEKIGDVSLSDVDPGANSVLRFRIGVDENAKNLGGINLFGKGFGDCGEHIILSLFYKQ